MVEQYRQTERLAPLMQGELTTRASAEDFGAATGRGLQQFAQGLQNAGQAISAVQALEDETRAKDAVTAYDREVQDLQYNPETGFLNAEGRNAVDGRKSYSEKLEALRKKHSEGLTGDARNMFERASVARKDQAEQSGMIHTSRERKSWINQSSKARVESLRSDAIAAYADSKAAETAIASGAMELASYAEKNGVDSDTLSVMQREFASGARMGIVGRMADDDPVKANEYFQKYKGKFTGEHQAAIEKTLKAGLEAEEGFRAGERIATGQRDFKVQGGQPARQFLMSKTSKDATHIDGLEETFSTNLAAMMQDMPAAWQKRVGVASGYRSPEHQARLYANAKMKYGDQARKFVAPPGKSHHNSGTAVDLSWDGKLLSAAPPEVKKWVRDNAKRYGLHLPMSWESWHVEPQGSRGGSRVVANSNSVSPMARAQSAFDIEQQLSQIENPRVRDHARRQAYNMLELQAKQFKATQDQAASDIFSIVERGGSPDDLPIETRLAAGQSAMTSAWSYHDAKLKRGEPKTDQVLLYNLRRSAAADPEGFAQENLLEYRAKLSNAEFKELTDLQTKSIGNMSEAIRTGKVYDEIYKAGEQQLKAAGVIVEGRQDDASKVAEAKRVAEFQAALRVETDLFIKANKRFPTIDEQQQTVAKLLYPMTVTTPGIVFNNEIPALNFEAQKALTPGATVKPRIEVKDIPPSMAAKISQDFKDAHGRDPSEDELLEIYVRFKFTGIPPRFVPNPKIGATRIGRPMGGGGPMEFSPNESFVTGGALNRTLATGSILEMLFGGNDGGGDNVDEPAQSSDAPFSDPVTGTVFP